VWKRLSLGSGRKDMCWMCSLLSRNLNSEQTCFYKKALMNDPIWAMLKWKSEHVTLLCDTLLDFLCPMAQVPPSLLDLLCASSLCPSDCILLLPAPHSLAGWEPCQAQSRLLLPLPGMLSISCWPSPPFFVSF
jgi:hypothetical protein